MRHPPPSPSRFRRVATAVAVAMGLLVVYSCSLLVETRDTQCQGNSDCGAFATDATCDMAKHICVAPTSGSSSSGTTSSSSSSSTSGATCDVDGGIAGGGCYNCAPTDNGTLLNHCAGGCIAFDNARVKLLAADGGLPSLPMPGPDGGM